MSNTHGARARRSRPDSPESRRPASILLTFVVVAALVPGAAVIAFTWLVRAVVAGWGPVLVGAALAATWPLLEPAWRELTGTKPGRPLGVPGWAWLGLLGAVGCWLLF